MKTIKALDGFSRTSAGDVFLRGMAVQAGMLGNPNFPNPTVDLAALKTDLERLSALVAESADGSKTIIAEKNKQREEVVSKLRLLARYVEVTCKNDMSMFMTSGFMIAGTRTPTRSMSERIRSADHGDNSGDVVLRLSAHPGAASYEVRYAPASVVNQPASAWTIQPVTNVKSRMTLKGLTPSVKYLFQVRAVIDNGYTDWTDSVTFICT